MWFASVPLFCDNDFISDFSFMTESIRESFIVTADDYGIRQTAEPILRLAREGKIDRVAVMVHYVSSEQVRDLLATGVKIDLHLELIQLLKSGEKMQENTLLRIGKFLLRYGVGIVTAKKAEIEWRSQIERFEELFGRLPDGLNSHEHVHFFPVFFKPFLSLMREYKIDFARFGSRGMLVDIHSAFVGKILAFLWKRDCRMFKKENVSTTDYHVSFDWLDDFDAFLNSLPEGTIELVVHPEREDEYRAILEYF